MTLLEYIKQSYLRPNKAILQSLGASDELIEYLLKTPSNTNINMVIDGFGINDGGSDVAVVGTAVVGTSKVG